MTLEEYFRMCFDKDTKWKTGVTSIDHCIRHEITEDGKVRFYIRPSLINGSTVDFIVEGNNLTTLSVSGPVEITE